MILSVDLGTSKICAMALDAASVRPLAIRSCENDAGVAGLPDDMHEQDPVRIRDLAFGLFRQALEDDSVRCREVRAVGISGQMHGVLLVDSELRPLTNLITWRDRRTAREGLPGSVSESLALLDSGAEGRTGCRLAVAYGAATLRWLHRNGALSRGCVAVSIAGFVAACLTGVVSVDETHAASWGILDLARNEWDTPSVERLGLPPETLPQIGLSARPLGEVIPKTAEQLGLRGRAVVCSPVGDAQASVIGAAGFAGDTVVVNIGTGAQISIPRPEPACTEELDAWPLPFGGYLQLGATLCGGWSHAYLKSFFQSVAREICGVELDDGAMYERMNALAASAEPGAGGLVADTRFSGTRKNKDIKGSIVGIDTVNLTPANLSLAVIEGLAADLHAMWASSGAAKPRRLIASGNAVRRNEVLRSAILRRFGTECFMSAEPEEAARGAAYAAAVGAGIASKEQVNAIVGELVDRF